MLNGILILAGLAVALTAMLLITARLLRPEDRSIAADIEALLPQIQCGQCGFPGCRPYALALAAGEAEINRCPPGGNHTIRALAELLGRDVLPLDASLGRASMAHIARIDEHACIGCNLCARACPVDAIAGVPQTIHTVIKNYCTGCELCLPPCPVDCITLVSRDA